MQDRFTTCAKHALEHARREAQRLGHAYVGTEHMLLGLLQEDSGVAVLALRALHVDFGRLRREVERLVQPGGASEPPAPSALTPRALRVLELAEGEANQLSCESIETGHLLLALQREKDGIAGHVLTGMGLDYGDLRRVVMAMPGEVMDEVPPLVEPSAPAAAAAPLEQPPAAADAPPAAEALGTPPLRIYCRDLTALAAQGLLDPVVCRGEEINRALRLLSRRQRGNALFIGRPGVGKTAIVQGLAQALARGLVPETLRGRRIFEIDLAAVLSGSRQSGMVEERMAEIVAETQRRADVILFLDDLPQVGDDRRGSGWMAVYAVLGKALTYGGVQCLATATQFYDDRRVEIGIELEQSFLALPIVTPTRPNVIAMLRAQQAGLERHHGVRYIEPALGAAAELAMKYLPQRALPGAAVDLLDEAGAWLRLQPFTGRLGEVLEIDRRLREFELQANDGGPRPTVAELGRRREALDLLRRERDAKVERLQAAARASDQTAPTVDDAVVRNAGMALGILPPTH